MLAVLAGPGGHPETKLAAQAAGKPCEAAGHVGLSRPAQFVCYELSAESASGLEARRRIFCSHQELFPKIH